jgi:hypothetical protein
VNCEEVKPRLTAEARDIPSLGILQVVVCWGWFEALKCHLGATFGFKTCSCTPLFGKAKPNRLICMLLIDNLLQSILRVKSLASFGNSVFSQWGRFGHHKRMVNFE